METGVVTCKRCGIEKKSKRGLYCRSCCSYMVNRKRWHTTGKLSLFNNVYNTVKPKPRYRVAPITLPKVRGSND
jgi:hypothetical protein